MSGRQLIHTVILRQNVSLVHWLEGFRGKLN